MIKIRKSEDRGQFDHGWLKTAHTFSFAGYNDPEHRGFRNLRVINEDHVAGGGGFPMHPHRDMEIITYVLEGELEHRDSLGNRGVIVPGVVQRMSAGTGIVHSEFNASSMIPVHLYQIWITPSARGATPGYEERVLPGADETGKFVRVASPDGAEGSLTIQADANLFAAKLTAGQQVGHEFAAGRHGWLQVMRGAAEVDGKRLRAGDGAAISDVKFINVTSGDDAELLLFDLA